MTLSDKSKIVLYCGALHDIAEKTKEKETKKQINDIRIKIEVILSKDSEIRKLIKTDNDNG